MNWKRLSKIASIRWAFWFGAIVSYIFGQWDIGTILALIYFPFYVLALVSLYKLGGKIWAILSGLLMAIIIIILLLV